MNILILRHDCHKLAYAFFTYIAKLNLKTNFFLKKKEITVKYSELHKCCYHIDNYTILNDIFEKNNIDITFVFKYVKVKEGLVYTTGSYIPSSKTIILYYTDSIIKHTNKSIGLFMCHLISLFKGTYYHELYHLIDEILSQGMYDKDEDSIKYYKLHKASKKTFLKLKKLFNNKIPSEIIMQDMYLNLTHEIDARFFEYLCNNKSHILKNKINTMYSLINTHSILWNRLTQKNKIYLLKKVYILCNQYKNS